MSEPITASGIVAQAFLHMELSPISGPDEDTPQAIDAARILPDALDMSLEAVDWSFASRLVFLPEVTDLPDPLAIDPDQPHVYQLPGDLLAVREVGDSFSRWAIDGEFLRADIAPPLRLRYTARVTDAARMPATFRTAVSLQLAYLMSPRWVTTQSKRDQITRELTETIARAAKNDARNASPQSWGQSDGGDWVQRAVS
jgi:hypothetical protein